MSASKRSAAVPLSLVSALAAAVGCGPSHPAVAGGVDPCLSPTYQQGACEYAVQHQGYYYGGSWYPHIYSQPALFYYNGYSHYVGSGGSVRVISPGSYAPGIGGAAMPSGARSTVVRGGFGGIGAAHGVAGS